MIKRLHVENFKCFDKNTFNFKNLTYLTGANACGKSSLLQILLLLNTIENSKDGYTVFPQIGNINLGLPNKLLSSNSANDKINMEIDYDDQKYSIIFSLSSKLNYQNFFVASGNVEEFVKCFSQYYLAAERISPHTFHKSGMKENYVGVNGEYTIEAISLFDNLGKIEQSHGYSIPFIDDKPIGFKKACESCLCDIFGNTELQVSGLEDEPGEKLLIKNNSEFYIPFATGFGISYCLPIVVQGLIAMLLKNRILIVENPEVHLHPKSQSELGRFLAHLAQNGVQVIVETHSEHIINGSRLQMGKENYCDLMNVIYFSKEGNLFSQTEISINKYGELSEWPDGFFDQEEKDLRELLLRKITCKK